MVWPVVMDEVELLHRCEQLVPTLEAAALEAEHLRHLPDATMKAAADADVFAAIVPTSLGGHGLGLRALAQATRVLAHGCPASAWTLSFLMLHGWLLSRMGPEVTAEVFADGPTALAPAPLAPTGKLIDVEGGHLLSGTWSWATGVSHADWVLVHALAPVRPIETRFVLLPIADVEVDDVWFTSGMRATGSNTIRVKDRFVPSHRVVPATGVMHGSSFVPGDGMAGLATPTALALVASSPALGAAEAAVELYRERLEERVLAYSVGARAADQPAAQVRFGTALDQVAAARDHWEAAIDIAAEATPAVPLDVGQRVRCRLTAAATVRAARATISTVCEGAGASVYLTSHPLQRIQRDVETLKGHVIFDWDRTTELAGRVALGGDPGPADLV